MYDGDQMNHTGMPMGIGMEPYTPLKIGRVSLRLTLIPIIQKIDVTPIKSKKQ